MKNIIFILLPLLNIFATPRDFNSSIAIHGQLSVDTINRSSSPIEILVRDSSDSMVKSFPIDSLSVGSTDSSRASWKSDTSNVSAYADSCGNCEGGTGDSTRASWKSDTSMVSWHSDTSDRSRYADSSGRALISDSAVKASRSDSASVFVRALSEGRVLWYGEQYPGDGLNINSCYDLAYNGSGYSSLNWIGDRILLSAYPGYAGQLIFNYGNTAWVIRKNGDDSLLFTYSSVQEASDTSNPVNDTIAAVITKNGITFADSSRAAWYADSCGSVPEITDSVRAAWKADSTNKIPYTIRMNDNFSLYGDSGQLYLRTENNNNIRISSDSLLILGGDTTYLNGFYFKFGLFAYTPAIDNESNFLNFLVRNSNDNMLYSCASDYGDHPIFGHMDTLNNRLVVNDRGETNYLYVNRTDSARASWKADTSRRSSYSDSSRLSWRSDTSARSFRSDTSRLAWLSDTSKRSNRSDTSRSSWKSDTSYKSFRSDTARACYLADTSKGSARSDSSRAAWKSDSSNKCSRALSLYHGLVNGTIPQAYNDSFFVASNIYQNDSCVSIAKGHMRVEFTSLGLTARSWSCATGTADSSIYAATSSTGTGPGIYKRTGGSGSWTLISGTAGYTWEGITYNPNGNIYACNTGNGNIYKQTSGTGSFNTIYGTGATRSYTDITTTPSGDMYVCVANGTIYRSTGGNDTFVSLGATTRAWNCIGSDADGNVYAGVASGDIYYKASGSSDWIALDQGTNPTKWWNGIAADLDGNVYASNYYGDIYIRYEGEDDFIRTYQSRHLGWRGMGSTLFAYGDVLASNEYSTGSNIYLFAPFQFNMALTIDNGNMRCDGYAYFEDTVFVDKLKSNDTLFQNCTNLKIMATNKIITSSGGGVFMTLPTGSSQITAGADSGEIWVSTIDSTLRMGF